MITRRRCLTKGGRPRRVILRALVMLGLSAVLVAWIVPYANADAGNNVLRLPADFQNSSTGVNEASTNVRPNEGGLLVYSKTLSIPCRSRLVWVPDFGARSLLRGRHYEGAGLQTESDSHRGERKEDHSYA